MPAIKSQILSQKIKRLSEKVVLEKELRAKLSQKRKLRIKYGVDVTSPFLHLGHAVNLWLLRAFQEAGHKVIFLVGDFTTRIGDPTGRSETRPAVSVNDIKKGEKEFIKQASQILLMDKKALEVRRNSEWYSKMKPANFVRLLSLVTHAKLIARDMFQKRIREKKEIYAHELIYPVLQGYDSVELKSDLTVIGSDQLFNEMMGRALQEKFGQAPQTILTTKITPGIHGGEKQSKSRGNYIGLADSARDKFGKVMSIPDDLIIQYLEVYTEVPMEEIKRTAKEIEAGSNPIGAKKRLARAIVSKYHSKKETEEAEKFFTETFQKKLLPGSAAELKVKKNIPLREVLVKNGFVKSNSEAARLVEAGGVELDGQKIKDRSFKLTAGGVLRIGKKRFLKIAVK